MDGQRQVIHPLSSIATLPQFDLWSVPPTQVSVARDLEPEYRPLAVITDGQPIEFSITSAVDEYINLQETRIFVKLRVRLRKADGRNPTAADWESVIPAQNLLHSMFSECSMEIGGREVTPMPQVYAYRAFLETLVGFSQTAKKTVLRGSLWNPIAHERNAIIKPTTPEGNTYGNWFELRGRLHLDLTFQGKLILGGTEIRIKLKPNNNRFIFRCNDGLFPEIDIAETKLCVHKSKVTPMLVGAHAKSLSQNETRYHVSRNEIRYQSIGAERLDAVLQNVIRGQLPRRMFVMLVDTEAFNGSFSKDPYDFNHFNLSFIAAYVDGQQYPATAFTPDFGSKLYLREYQELFSCLDNDNCDPILDLDYDTFEKNKCILPFQFSPDLSNGPGADGHLSCLSYGSLSLHLKFSQKLAKAINVILYCEFDSMLHISEDRTVTTNFSN